MYTINRRASDGGTSSTDTLTNCTFGGNTAGQSGGGVGTVGYVQSQFSDCTISGNTANQSGGGLFIAPYQGYLATSEIGNTIVAGNAAATSGPDASGTLVSQGNNLIGETDGSGMDQHRPHRHRRPTAQPPAGAFGRLRRADPDHGTAARQPGN